VSAKRLPPPPTAPLPFTLPTFTGTRLSNGVAVRATRWGRRPTVAVSVLFPGAGSAADPPGREGTAELTGDTFLGGTRRRDARALGEALAAILEVSAGSDSSVARLFVLEKDLDEGLALLAEVLTESTFPADEFEKNRRRQIDVLAEQRSEPDFLARERLLDRLYPGHPYGRLTATEKGLASLTQAEVAAFAASRFSLRNATLILAGAADPGALLSAAERVFGSLPAGVASPPAVVPPPPEIPGFAIHLVNRPGSVQTNLLFARTALNRRDPRFTAALVANQSLGGGASSRLFHVLREERSLTYGAYSSVSARVAGGQFGASIDCRTEVTKEAFAGLFDLIKAYASEGPTAEEHDRSRKYLLGSFPIPRETPGGVAQDEIARLLHGLPEDEWSTWRDRVRAVSREAAFETAREFFEPSTGILSAVGDAKVIRPVLESFGDTTLWDSDGPRS
jgi:predicted Zn-dependent peptidase